MLQVYHSRRARSVRIVWLLEELSVPYELVSLDFKPEVLKSPEYLKLHPLGQIPVLQDGALTMFESGAILEYLLETYGQGRLAPAPGSKGRAAYLQWFHYGEASLARAMSDIVRMRFGQAPVDAASAELAGARTRFCEALGVVEQALAGREYICGDTFNAADIMVSYGIVMGRIIREVPSELVNVTAYLARLKQRPAYERAWA